MKLAALLLVAAPAFALPLHVREGDVQALAQLTDPQGQALADGHYTQVLVGEVLYIEATFDYPDGRKVLEKAQLRLHPQLEQLSWSRLESKGDQPVRRYSMDFATRKATAEHLAEQKHWEEQVDVDPGKTFAGIAFNYAVKNLRKELAKGGTIKLHAIAFTPKPRAAEVTVRRDGDDRIRMAGREILADKYTIHPEIPAIAKLFISVPDQFIWLWRGEPAAFLRFEGPSAEPKDPILRIDTIAGPRARIGRHPAEQAAPSARAPKPSRRPGAARSPGK